MADYDISAAFQEIEDYLLSSMIRNMSHHKGAELKDGMEYSQWQAEQLKGLQIYRQNNQKRFGSKFSTLNYKIEETIKAAYTKGGLDQETAILKAIKKGFVPPSKKLSKTAQSSAEFFKVNEKKLNTLINATISDMKKAEHAVLRMANDQYRKAIFNAQVAYNTGTVTMPQAIDMATKDYLAKGINCIEYANGARVAIDAYARMALKTANTRAYLQGESAKRDEWGINTVIVNRRGVACPKCLQWVCKVYYDDVYGNVPVTDNKYPKLSTAIAGGLYHPNCKDSHTTYFEGISSHPKPLTKQEEAEAARVYNLEQQQRYNERNIRKYKRLQAGSIDPDNQQMYGQKVKQWQQKNINLISQNPELKRNYGNEKSLGISLSKKDIVKIGPIVKFNEYDIIRLTTEEEEIFKKLPFVDVSNCVGKMSDRAVRKWYKWHDDNIMDLIDRSSPLEDQARMACDLRNKYRTQARDLMRDQEKRKELDKQSPNASFEELIDRKMEKKGMTREEAVADILKTSTKTNKEVNKKFGLEE